MKHMSQIQKMILVTLPIALALTACTKKLDYKTEYKGKVEDKSIISTSELYLYTPSQDKSSRTDSGIRPYWKGEEKLVKFQFTEKELQVTEVEKDPRFQENTTNNKLVMSIPVEHIEYRCAQDTYGQCTNKEEKNTEISWKQRSKFKPDFTAVHISEANMLPAEMDKIFGGKCYTESASQLLDAKVDGDSINIRVEKTFNVNLECIKDATSLGDLLSNLTSTAVYHYSFTKLSSIASNDYTPVNYPSLDENTFGFFTSDFNKLDVDGNATINSKSTLMNRWNPNRKEIIYYLSDEFNKPENQLIKQATLESFNRINRGLESAGVQFRVVAKDAEGKNPGDNRNSFIVLVEDPLAASILGYGPSVANPQTGEILSARVVMYSGVLKQFIRWTYEEIRRAEFDKKTTIEAKIETPVKNNNKQLEKIRKSLNTKQQYTSAKNLISAFNLTSEINNIKSAKIYSTQKTKDKDTLSVLSQNCNYPAELFNFNEAAATALKNKVGGTLKPWMDLSDNEKQEIVNIVLPHVWIPTLVHEMGHNLGLRHNFKGSEDKENFYSDAELKKMNIDRAIPYSSVMDYPYTDLNHLPTLGKYDIAALRFAYLREVETKSGKMIKIKNNLNELSSEESKEIKDYAYCTDEHVGANVGCKRFDEGTNLTQIVKHQIKSYKTVQENRNYRNGRASMSATEDHLYASRVWDTFSNLRMYLSVMSRIKNNFGIDYNHEVYEKNEFLKDLKQATLISLDFLITVITTPDVNCVVENNKTKEVSTVPLTTFSKNYTSCQEITLKDGYRLVSQFGTFLNHVKDEKSGNSYVDQIDIRGTWIDKLLATRALLDRSLSGAAINSTDNFLDLVEGQQKIPAMLALFVDGSSTSEISVPSKDGKVTKVPVTANFADEMLVRKTMSPQLLKGLGLPDRDFYISEWIYNYAKSTLKNTAQLNYVGEAMADYLSVTKVKSNQPINVDPAKTKGYQFGDYTYIASTERNPFAAGIIQNIEIMELLNNKEVREEKLKLIAEAKIAGKEVDATSLNDSEKEIAKLSKEELSQALNTKIPSHGYLIRLLNVMAN